MYSNIEVLPLQKRAVTFVRQELRKRQIKLLSCKKKKNSIFQSQELDPAKTQKVTNLKN